MADDIVRDSINLMSKLTTAFFLVSTLEVTSEYWYTMTNEYSEALPQ